MKVRLKKLDDRAKVNSQIYEDHKLKLIPKLHPSKS